jgi:hypothetical protein
MGKLQTHIDGLWREALREHLADDALEEESVLIQNQVFHSRLRNLFVFNWVYRVLRGEKEKTMDQVSAELVEQALKGRLTV